MTYCRVVEIFNYFLDTLLDFSRAIYLFFEPVLLQVSWALFCLVLIIFLGIKYLFKSKVQVTLDSDISWRERYKINKEKFLIDSKNIFFICFLTLFIIEILNILFILSTGNPSKNSSEASNYLNIAAASISILFPVALLIIDEKRGDDFSLVLRSQALLSYSWAMPAGIALLSGMGRYSFNLHEWTGVFISIYSTTLAAFVFYRLIRITLHPGERKKTEEAIIRDLAFDMLEDIAKKRIKTNLTNKSIEAHSNRGLIDTDSSLMPDSEKVLKIKSLKSGIIEKIDIKALAGVVDNIIRNISDVKTAAVDNPARVESPRRNEVQINIKVVESEEVHVESIIAEVFVENYSKINEGNKPPIKQCEGSIRNAFNIQSTTGDDTFSKKMLEYYFNRIRLIAIDAAGNGDLVRLELLEENLAMWLGVVAKDIKRRNIEYDSMSAKKDYIGCLFNQELSWPGIEETERIIHDSYYKALSCEISDQPLCAKKIIDITDNLFIDMAYEGEFFLCNRLLKIKSRLFWKICNRPDHPGGDFLLSAIYDNFRAYLQEDLRIIIEPNANTDIKRKFFLNITRSIFYTLQDCLRCLLLMGKFDLYKKFLKLTLEYPKLYQYQDIEASLITLGFEDDLSVSDRKKIEELKKKKHVLDEVDRCQKEICMGQVMLSVMMKEGKADLMNVSFKNEDVMEYISLWKHHFPTSLKGALALYISTMKAAVEHCWGWGFWEKHSDEDGAHEVEMYVFLNDSLTLALIYAAKNNGSSDLLSDKSLWDMPKLYQRIDKNMELAIEVGLISENQKNDVKSNLKKYLDDCEGDYQRIKEERLSQYSIEERVIESIKRDFDKTFKEKSWIRHVVRFSNQGKNSSDSSWGINELHKKEYFEEGIHWGIHGTFGREYGSRLANEEGKFVFCEILNQLIFQKNMTFSSLVNKYIQNGFDLKDAVILFSPLNKIMKPLRKVPGYIPFYKAPENIRDNYSPQPDSFFRQGEYYIPIYNVFVRDNNKEGYAIIFPKNSISLDQTVEDINDVKTLPESGFCFELKDPLEDQEFLNEILEKNPSWIKELNRKEKVKKISLHVGIKFLQRIKVTPDEKRVIVGRLINNDQLSRC